VPTRQLHPVVGLAAILLLGGCALPDGVDGDLTGGWSAMPEPVVFEPEAGACHDRYFHDIVTMSTYRPVPCEDGFRLQTVHVGTFTGDVADRLTPPGGGSPEMREAFGECDAAAAEFLGEDFRHGRLWLGVARPSRHAWEGGARWFRCDVGVWRVHERDYALIRHEGSLRDALADESDLRLGCYQPTISEDDGSVETMKPVDCDEPHTTEFVGVWTAPDTSYPDFDVTDDDNRLHRGCRRAVAEYVGVPDDGDLRFRTGTIAWLVSEEDWDAGNRGIGCYLWLPEREISRSLAGAGESGLPIR
jgi:hypothetical protein